MAKLVDSIRDRARTDLVIETEQGDQDLFLWEHADRIAQSAQAIMRLPRVRTQAPDQIIVVAAALYHDAGWIARLEDGEVQRSEILVRPPSNTHREQSALYMESRLEELLPPKVLERASIAVRSMNDRNIESIEGQIVAEAENLDEFGLLAFWPNIRRHALDGRGVQAAIDTWNRQKEYRFWTARLNDSFRFDEVRQLARERLAKYERAMEELAEQHRGVDLAMILDAVRPSPGPLPR